MTKEHKITLSFTADIEGDDFEDLPNYLKMIAKMQIVEWFNEERNIRDVEVKIEEK